MTQIATPSTPSTHKQNLTKAIVEGVPLGTYVYDAKQRGLYLQVSKTGKRTFGVYVWDRVKRKPYSKAIGPWPSFNVEQARREAATIVAAVDRGEHEQREQPTLGDLADRYELSLKATGARHPGNNNHLIDLACRDWRRRDAAAITRQEVEQRHVEIATTRGATAAAKFIKVLRAFYRHADIACPATKVRIANIKPRQRIATAAELERIKAELAKQPEHWRDYFMLSLLTGARRDNVASMRFEDVREGVWTIPAAEAKQGDAIVLPLQPEAVEIVERRKAQLGNGYVFPSHGSTGRLTSTWDRWQEIRVAAGVPDMTQHDLRRTFISRLAEAGVHPSVASRLAGHRSIITTMRHYTVVNDKQLRDALAKVA